MIDNKAYTPVIELVAESDSEFDVKNLVTSVVFTRNPQGTVDGIPVNGDGQEMAAKKLR